MGLSSVAAFGFIDESFPTHRPVIEKLVYHFITTLQALMAWLLKIN